VPCTARARGTTAGANPPFNAVTDNDPCGRKTVLTINGGASVSSHSLCLFHLMQKLGQSAVGPPYTFEA
jgi:hypothetical protein